MKNDDSVDPGDAALQAVLAGIADRTPDGNKRDEVLDYILTIPPLKHWPTASLVRLQDICTFVAGLSRQLEERRPDLLGTEPDARSTG